MPDLDETVAPPSAPYSGKDNIFLDGSNAGVIGVSCTLLLVCAISERSVRRTLLNAFSGRNINDDYRHHRTHDPLDNGGHRKICVPSVVICEHRLRASCEPKKAF